MRWLSSLFLFPIAVFAQGEYMKLQEIEVPNNREKEILEQALVQGKASPLSFLAIAYEDEAKFDKWVSHFDEEMSVLASRKVKKNKAKDLNQVYKRLHDRFLTKYEFVAYFDEIFETGVYNCVTAVALYALTFDRLGIDYQIKETPTHVYMVADPEGEQLLIETTDPVNGFTTFSRSFKEAYVAQLVDRKLVDRTDLKEGVNAVFDHHYFGSDNLTVLELLGLQYSNRGLELFERSEYFDAWWTLAKAQLFYSGKDLNKSLFAALVNHLAACEYDEPEDLELLRFLPRFAGKYIKRSEVVGEYTRMLHRVLISNGDEEKADSLFAVFNKEVSDVEVLKGIAFCHNYERGRLLHDRGRYRESFEFARRAYAVKPENADAEKLMVRSLAKADFSGGDQEASIIIDSLLLVHPDLSNNNHFLGLRLNTLLDRMSARFREGHWNEGTELREQFEAAALQTPEAIFHRYKVGDAYSAAAVYYFKRDRLTTARQVIHAGLQFAPDNMELKNRLYMINR